MKKPGFVVDNKKLDAVLSEAKEMAVVLSMFSFVLLVVAWMSYPGFF